MLGVPAVPRIVRDHYMPCRGFAVTFMDSGVPPGEGERSNVYSYFARSVMFLGTVLSTIMAVGLCIALLPAAVMVLAIYGFKRFIDG